MSIALRQWVRPLAYCEVDKYCQSVLLSRMLCKTITMAPIWDDITTFPVRELPQVVDIIYAGFPCQDISIAGTGVGLAGKRSGLIYEILRLSRELRPTFIFLENVPAITTRGGLVLVQEITKMRYDCRWCVISAASVGATHKRERWFLLAHTKSERLQTSRQPLRSSTSLAQSNNDVKHYTWNEEPEDKLEMVGVDDGLRCRSHRIKALGNAVVPFQAKEAFRLLMGLQ